MTEKDRLLAYNQLRGKRATVETISKGRKAGHREVVVHFGQNKNRSATFHLIHNMCVIGDKTFTFPVAVK